MPQQLRDCKVCKIHDGIPAIPHPLRRVPPTSALPINIKTVHTGETVLGGRTKVLLGNLTSSFDPSQRMGRVATGNIYGSKDKT